jgi:hypothetical protein
MGMDNKLNERRTFIKTIGLGAAGLSLGAAKSDAANEKKTLKSMFLPLLNGFEFEFISSGDLFLGIGAIKIKNLPLRSGKMPMFAEIHTPDAIRLVNHKIENKTISETGIDLDFSVQKIPGDTMEWMLHTVRNRRNMSGWNREPENAPDTRLTMRIRPAERKIGDLNVTGFSYQYIYKSDSLPVYKITDRASWEIDGSATGNELWMRNGVVDSIVAFSNPGDFYSTEWYMPGEANPNIFQFHPWQTQLQGFSFTSAKQGTLITWATEVAHIRSLFEKWRNYNEIMHFHEHCNDLGSEFTTSPVEVLWIPGELDRVGRANLYNDLREMVHEELHRQIGMKRERITTYGIIEEWEEPDFEKYTKLVLPKLLEAGVKKIFIPNQCQNDMNTWGLSNFCCNVDYKISDTVGEEKLADFCKVAKAGDAKVEMWANTAISTTTERFMHPEGREKGIRFLPYQGSIMQAIDKAEAPFIRNPSNAIEADHYSPRFCALNLRDKDIRSYWMKQWKYLHDKIGLEGIFLDSSFNMTSDKFHHMQYDRSKDRQRVKGNNNNFSISYRPEHEPPASILTQYHVHLQCVVEMQQMGYEYCAEDMGVFGINRTGPDLVNRISSLPIWADCYCDFNEYAVKRAGYEPLDIFFKGLAYRMMWKLNWNLKRDRLELGIKDPRAFQMIKVYNEVTDFMISRKILEHENGVVYTHNQCKILWAFNDFDAEAISVSQIKDILTGKEVPINNDKFSAKKNSIYKIILQTPS